MLFVRASKRQDCAAHPLAMFMLGWIHESQQPMDLRAAERYYVFALQLEPIHPFAFLKLSKTAENTATYVNMLLEEKQNGATKENKKSKKISSWTSELFGLHYIL